MHNLFQTSKTLRFELKPIGKTQEYFEQYILEQDEMKSETFKKVKKVTLEVTAKGKTKTCSKNLDIYMSKESGKWLVICTDDMGSISYMIE